MSIGRHAEKFKIVCNDHGRTQKCNFCVCLKSKTVYICRFSSSSCSPQLLQNIEEFGAKKYFTDHCTPSTINGFRYSVLVWYDCYCKICKNFEQHSIPSQVITMDRLDKKKKHFKMLLNVLSTTYTYSNCILY